MDSKLINATGLWLQTDKNGNSYMSGTLGGARVLIFKSKDKKSSKHPDYYLCFGSREPKPTDRTDDVTHEDAPF